MAPLFRDRADAGRQLADELAAWADRPDVRVLALPRGGVPVAFEVARRLRAPLDVYVVRKLGAPDHEELAMGAIATGGVTVRNDEVIALLRITEMQFERVAAIERLELERRERRYRGDRPPPDLTGCAVILVDDGLATGATMRAAVEALTQVAPGSRVVAVPVAAPETCEAFREHVDQIVCAATPEPFRAVGLWYEDFSQTSDDEVHELLERARGWAAEPPAPKRS